MYFCSCRNYSTYFEIALILDNRSNLSNEFICPAMPLRMLVISYLVKDSLSSASSFIYSYLHYQSCCDKYHFILYSPLTVNYSFMSQNVAQMG